MLMLGVLLIVSCLAAVVLGRAVQDFRMVGLVGGAALVYVAGWIVWWGLLFFQVVRIDPVLRSLGIHRLNPPWTTIVFLVPPLVPAAAFALAAARR